MFKHTQNEVLTEVEEMLNILYVLTAEYLFITAVC